VPFSCKQRRATKYFFDFAFDFGLAELAQSHARRGPLPCRTRCGSRGKAQMFTYVSTT
jgi:hypothetical protein